MNRVIIPTGYMGSGSSAITDIVSGFDNFAAPKGSFEYVFMHCPNGLFDLEDKLLVGNNALRSDEALRSFYTAMKELFPEKLWWPGNYEKNLSPRFMDITREFLRSITQFESDGYWYFQQKRGIAAFPRLALNKLLRTASGGRARTMLPLRYKGMLLSFATPQEFYSRANKYLAALFAEMGLGENNLVLDQLILPHNAWRMENYFDSNVECVIVDRDPRDVFISNKYIWGRVYGSEIPYPFDVHEFCSYYRRIRTSEKPTENVRIHRIHFEDLIYEHEASMERIASIVQAPTKLDASAPIGFSPAKSINNTQLFLLNDMQDEANIIERELEEYLYDFPERRIPERELSF